MTMDVTYDELLRLNKLGFHECAVMNINGEEKHCFIIPKDKPIMSIACGFYDTLYEPKYLGEYATYGDHNQQSNKVYTWDDKILFVKLNVSQKATQSSANHQFGKFGQFRNVKHDRRYYNE